MSRNVIHLGRVLRSLRKAAGMSQTDLAKRAGIARTVVVELEQGSDARCFSGYTEQLASVFGKDILDLGRFWLLSSLEGLQDEADKVAEKIAADIGGKRDGLLEEARQGRGAIHPDGEQQMKLTWRRHPNYGHPHTRGNQVVGGGSFLATLLIAAEQPGPVSMIMVRERTEKRLLAKARRVLAAWERKHSRVTGEARLTVLPIR